LPVGIGAVILLQFLFTYARPMQVLFETEGLPLWVWGRLLIGGLVFFLVVETEKLILRHGVFRQGSVAPVEATA
jgi:hypothetical protein